MKYKNIADILHVSYGNLTNGKTTQSKLCVNKSQSHTTYVNSVRWCEMYQPWIILKSKLTLAMKI